MVKVKCDVSQNLYQESLVENKILSYVIKNAHINCDHDTYDVLNKSIVKPINDDMKTLMNKYIFVFLL